MATTKQPGLAKNNDMVALYNKAYPQASKAQAGTVAQNQQNVDDMSVRDRLWDSYDFTYGQQRQESDRSFDQAYSQAANQQVARGMQRSSYGAQTLANLNQQKIDAQNKIYGQQIAAYEQALMNVEQQEREQANWETQFNESVRQFNVLHPQATAGGGGGGGGGGGSSRGGGGRGGNGNGGKDTKDPNTGSLLDRLQSALSGKDGSAATKMAGVTTGAYNLGGGVQHAPIATSVNTANKTATVVDQLGRKSTIKK